MTERKSPPKDVERHNVADELFDRDHLSDSDSDFLSELDRVLSGQADSQPPTPDSEAITEFAEPGHAPPGGDLDLDLGDWEDPFASPLPENPPSTAEALEAPPPRPDREPPPEIDVRAPDREAALPGDESDEPFPAESWDEPLELDTENPVGAAATTGEPVPPEDESAEPPAPEPPRGTELLQEQDISVAVAAAAAAATAAAASPAPAPPAAAPAPAPQARGGSPAWAGALALMALLGVGLGAAGLWRASVLEQRLVDLPTPSSAVSTGPAPTAPIAGDAGLEVRLDALQERVDVEIAQLSGELEELGTTLVRQVRSQEPSPPTARDDTALAELHAHLEQVRQQLVAMEKQVAASAAPAPPPETKPAAAARSAKSPPPVSKPGRTWAVNLTSLPQEEAADRELRRLRADGLPAQKRTVEKDGKTWYRLAVGGFDDYDTAKAFAAQVRGRSGLDAVWIGRE